VIEAIHELDSLIEQLLGFGGFGGNRPHVVAKSRIQSILDGIRLGSNEAVCEASADR